MATTMPSGAKKIDSTDNWRDIFDCHNDTCDAVEALNTAIEYYRTSNGQSKRLSTGSCNDLTTNGRWYVASSVSDKPRSGGGYIDVFTYDTDWVTQTFYGEGSGNVYTRRKAGANNWTDWEELALNSNLIKFTDKTTTPGSAGEVAISTVTSGLVSADNLINVVVLDLNNATADIYTYNNAPYVRVHNRNDYSDPITTSVRLRIWYKP